MYYKKTYNWYRDISLTYNLSKKLIVYFYIKVFAITDYYIIKGI